MAFAIRLDRTPTSLRKWARRAEDPRAASRSFAIANALEGMSRAEAARLAGMERQALRAAVVRDNAEGVAGLSAWPRHRASRWTEGQQATLRALILRGPDPECDGVSSWTRADIPAHEPAGGPAAGRTRPTVLRGHAATLPRRRDPHRIADPLAGLPVCGTLAGNDNIAAACGVHPALPGRHPPRQHGIPAGAS